MRISDWEFRRVLFRSLDIGTGTGRLLEVLAPQIKRGLGVDLSREMLGIARANLERAGIRHCQVRQADMYALPLDSASVDAAVIHPVRWEERRVGKECVGTCRAGGSRLRYKKKKT